MVKTPSSVPDVFLVGPAGGKLRPWCGKCHKFLKSETAPHDCSPIDFAKVRAARAASGGSKPRKFRMTKRRAEMLKKLVVAGGIVKTIGNALNQMEKASSPKKLLAVARSMKKALAKKDNIAKKTSSMYNKFF